MTDINRLLDNGHAVVLYKNSMGSYVAFSTTIWRLVDEMDASDEAGHLTDHFTAHAAIAALADKITNTGRYSR